MPTSRQHKFKGIFSTGQAAAVCRSSQQSVIRAIDRGLLKGYRMPGSKFRRVPAKELLKFLQTYGIPTDLFFEKCPELAPPA